MKLFNRIFVSPILLHKTSTHYSSPPDIEIRWEKHKMAGTMKMTTYTIDILVCGKKKQWSFVWRPGVTRYWWKRMRII